MTPDKESKEPRAESKEQAPEFGANGGIQPGRYYGHGLPYVPIDHYPGKIIAIEGTDGVGRSTQIALLREWLEVQGYGVVETGWTRSALMQPTIELAKSSNTLNKLTFVLLYATDFADRLEKEIIPALKAGFVVLSDRYIFSALARAGVRGVDRAWLRSLYGFAIAPHLVFYLKIDVDTLIRRVLSARGMDFWESGHGPEGRRRHLRQFPFVSEQAAARIRVDGRRVRVPGARRPPPGRRAAGGPSPPGAGVPVEFGHHDRQSAGPAADSADTLTAAVNMLLTLAAIKYSLPWPTR